MMPYAIPRRFRRLTRPIVAAAAIALLTIGCVTPSVTMDTPPGFAAYADSRNVRVISPEGVVLRVRAVPNDPPQTLQFWAEALERQLTESGYLLFDKAEISLASVPGVLMEWLAPVSEDDWIYLTAVGVVGTQIAVVEAAGPTADFDTYRQSIRDSLETLKLEAPES